VKRIAMLIAVGAAGLAAARSWRARRADAQLWHEATARDLR
jgi:hypothetical protein